MNCKKFEKLYWLKSYGESVADGNEALEAHLKSCSACQAEKAEIDRMQALLSLRPVAAPKEEALQKSRNLLSARLDCEKEPSALGWSWNHAWDKAQEWLSSGWQPALALSMLIIGLAMGRFMTLQGGSLSQEEMQSAYLDHTTWESQYIAEKVLNEDARISDVRVKPVESQPGIVQVSFQGTNEYTITGNPDDDIIRDLLTWTVKNDRNSGARLRSVEELAKGSPLSSQAQQALAYALINDENAGVRLRAMEALSHTPKTQETEQAFLGALLKDPNPAVRIRAIDLLLTDKQLKKSEELLLSLAEADSNEYVRMRARQIIKQSEFNYDVLENKSSENP
ncbi:HEAT repeat domain-containing protein [bacterium]|nr:HEAT repeat domain-containing protein [bacterium]